MIKDVTVWGLILALLAIVAHPYAFLGFSVGALFAIKYYDAFWDTDRW